VADEQDVGDAVPGELVRGLLRQLPGRAQVGHPVADLAPPVVADQPGDQRLARASRELDRDVGMEPREIASNARFGSSATALNITSVLVDSRNDIREFLATRRARITPQQTDLPSPPSPTSAAARPPKATRTSLGRGEAVPARS
jgi:hypothetical protein